MKAELDSPESNADMATRVTGGDLTVKLRQTNPRWNNLFTAAQAQKLPLTSVYGAVFEGEAGRLTENPLYPYQKAALIIDKAGNRTPEEERQFILDEYRVLKKHLENRKKALTVKEYENGQKTLQLLKDTIYPDFFSEEIQK